MSSASGDSFTSSLPIWIILFCFSCLIAVGMNLHSALTEAVTVGVFVLILNLAESLSSFHF
jgi:predicted amidohydrolase